MDRDLEVHRLTARLRALRRFSLDLCLGRIVDEDDRGARLRRAARPHRQRRPTAARRLALARGRAVLRRDPRQPDGSGQPTPVPLDRAAGSPTTGTRSSPRTASRGTPRSTTSRRSSPAWAAAARRGCVTCSAPSRPTRTPSSGPARAAPSSSTAARARARRSSPCTAPPTCSTPTRASGIAAAACCSSARTSPTWPTSPTCSPAWARRACRPAPLRDLVPEGATAPDPRPTRTWPASSRPRTW